jgi:ATP-binding cassette subfamily B protein
MRAVEMDAIRWPVERLPDAIAALCERAGLQTRSRNGAPVHSAATGDTASVIEWHAEALGCEAHPVHTNLRDIGEELRTTFPAIVQVNGLSIIAVLHTNGRALRVIAPDLRIHKIPRLALVRWIREDQLQKLQEPFRRLLDEVAVKPSRRECVFEKLLEEQLALTRFERCWLLRPQPGEPARRWLQHSNAYRIAAGLLGTHTVQYLLWLASWAILGSLSFAGRMDRGWLLAWALLLITLVPFRVLTTWLEGLLAIGIGVSLKRRLLLGALKLQPDEMRHQGMGSFLSQVLEAEAVETLALSGGIAGLLAIVEIVVSAFVLGRIALVLLLWCAVTAFACWRFVVRYQKWTDTRMLMTKDLIERMVGHRTRLAQESRGKWHDSEDEMLSDYVGASRRVDSTGTWLITAITRGWLLVGLGCLAPAIVTNKSAASNVAVALGGVLLAQTGFKRLTASFTDITGAWVSWKRIAFLFKAAGRKPLLGNGPALASAEPYERIVEAERLSFRYRPEGRPAVQGLTMFIHRGDRILLEGSSGGGKTTFASLLSGVREPTTGLLLVNGLDRQTLGSARWRKAIAAAPQFHENHILTETLAFNLLMGRRWPPLIPDLEEAEALCRELGLGGLLERMPGGILQMVGEGGWQLSHGERSRVYIARALLQQSDLVILDESFGALDPENLQTALDCTLRHAKTLMVIAHP